MNSEKLLEAIGELPERMIRDAERAKRRNWIGWIAAAACLCVGIFAVAHILPKQAESPARKDAADAALAERPQGEPMVILDGSDYVNSQTEVCYATPEPGEVQLFMEVRDALESSRGTDVRLFLHIALFDADGVPLAEESDETIAEAQRLASLGYEVGWYEAWTYQGAGEKVPYSFLYGMFTPEELENFQASPAYGYSFFFQFNGDGSPVVFTTPGVVLWEAPQPGVEEAAGALTEVEAYAAFGVYLPEAAPEGFWFEGAYSPQGHQVSVLWTGDNGELTWQVRDFSEADQARCTSTADREKYDRTLYSVPYADSVPGELWEIVDHPIFDCTELTQEVVNARAEPGDEAVRYCFGVRYGETLVEVTAKGVSPEWLYAQLIAIPVQ